MIGTDLGLVDEQGREVEKLPERKELLCYLDWMNWWDHGARKSHGPR